jgi:hypothetical protein
VSFPLGVGNSKDAESGSQIRSAKVVFPRPVGQADAALGGFRLQYGKRDDDRNFFEQQVEIENVTIDDNVVSFDVHAYIQDENPGGREHAFEGEVTVVVIADLA